MKEGQGSAPWPSKNTVTYGFLGAGAGGFC